MVLITMGVDYTIGVFIPGTNYILPNKNVKEAKKDFAPLVIREPSEYEDDDYHTELDRGSV